jgi:hypothetical protein
MLQSVGGQGYFIFPEILDVHVNSPALAAQDLSEIISKNFPNGYVDWE